MQIDYKVYIQDILEAINKIEEYANKLSYESFSNNRMVVDAVVRNLEVMGEVAKNIPLDIKKKYNNVEWKKIIGFRDIVIHAYFGIDLKIVWDIVENKVQELKRVIELISKELKL